jgi:hypothetical protein
MYIHIRDLGERIRCSHCAGLEKPRFEPRLEERLFSCSTRPDGPEAHSVSCSVDTGLISWGTRGGGVVKRLGRQFCHSAPSSAEVTNE